MRCIFKLNNKGSSLLMVIVCMGFISILCLTMLSLTTANVESKRINLSSKSNFYSAEQFLDEIYIKLSQDIMESLKKAYKDTLASSIENVGGENYMMKTNEKLTKECKKLLFEHVKTKYQTNTADILRAYVITPLGLGDNLDVKVNSFIVDSEVEPTKITFKNVELKLVHEGFENTIITDIVIKLPDVNFNLGRDNNKKDFPLVANGISLASSSDAVIKGNIYVENNGIVLENTSSKLTINNHTGFPNNVVVNGDIKVSKSNSLYIKALDSFQNLNIFCNNIKTENGSGSGISTIDINATTIVADDLELNAGNSSKAESGTDNNVKISGSYLGYSYNHNADGIEGEGTNYIDSSSSSIIVNSPNANLDLSGLSDLYLAGVAYIDIPNTEGIITGESIAIKSNQNVYLIPAKDLLVNNLSVSSNPFKTEETIEDSDLKVSDDFINKIEDNVCIGLERFDDIIELKSFNVANFFVEDQTYCYLKFKNTYAATRFIKYMDVEENIAQEGNKRYKGANIILPTNNLYTGGFVSNVTYTPSSSTINAFIPDGSSLIDDAFKLNIENEYKAKFNNAINISEFYDLNKINEINDDLLIAINASGTSVIYLGSTGGEIPEFNNITKFIYISKSDLNSDNELWNKLRQNLKNEFNGIIISKGNVDLDFGLNKKMNGMIYTSKILKIIGYTTINNDYNSVKDLLSTYGNIEYRNTSLNRDKIVYLLKNYNITPEGLTLEEHSYKDFIYYENWHKK